MKILLLATCISIILSGCGSQEPPASVTSPEIPEMAQAEPGKAVEPAVLDESINEAENKPESKLTSAMKTPGKKLATLTLVTDNKKSKAVDSGILSRQDALVLARKSGCLACHAIEKKLVGPAWKDVAAHYSGKPESQLQLIEKVKKGGKGNWTKVTGGTPMPPYSPRVSDHNIQQLVTFILSLNQ